ncbi:hypothetical protein Cfla_2180 [Cellulomonas flavigena DSM 20109]|uniref:Uncharacterized protein n=1 Tax=Cellulomonas flavigena (strain ATCC 482 / DSM 20109 / BCRC 11376 / JCM 18109 / NBRC 3775 / NCIMB 8073 / NRS 134) TaxID=446466 RepID=D5UG48_CELFN|nr:hypothetical protein [Cellulomonas flavigena]ADG75071.1 hypothetical protein Cfla_2180 [Cellulomonas flavigena DSM 20109]
MNPVDEQVLDALRRHADAAPPMTVDVRTTVAAGRRRRARTTAGVAAAAATLPVAVALALGAGLGDRGTALPAVTEPSPPTASAVPAVPPGTDAPAPPPVEPAPGLRAASGLGQRTLPDGTVVWDTGLTDRSGQSSLAFWPRGQATDGTVRVGFGELLAGHVLDHQDLVGDPRATLADHGSDVGYGEQYDITIGDRGDLADHIPAWETGTYVEASVGVVPAWMPGARVALGLWHGAELPGGGRLHLVELPTFTLDPSPGPELYAYTMDPSLLLDAQHGPHGPEVQGPPLVVFVGTDGATYVNGVPVTPQWIGSWVPAEHVDTVVAELRAMGATL